MDAITGFVILPLIVFVLGMLALVVVIGLRSDDNDCFPRSFKPLPFVISFTNHRRGDDDEFHILNDEVSILYTYESRLGKKPVFHFDLQANTV